MPRSVRGLGDGFGNGADGRPVPGRHVSPRPVTLIVSCPRFRRDDTRMPDPQQLTDALRGAYATWGYPIILIGALLENTALLGLFLPGGSLVLLGAVYAQQGTLAVPLVLVLGWAGTVLGTSVDFALGWWGLRAALRRTRWHAPLEAKLVAAERFLERHGAGAFLLAHFAGHIRSFVALTAGASRLPYRRFLIFESIAALIWNLVYVGAGYVLGGHLDALQRLTSGWGLAMALLAAVAYVAYRLVTRRHNAPAAGQ